MFQKYMTNPSFKEHMEVKQRIMCGAQSEHYLPLACLLG